MGKPFQTVAAMACMKSLLMIFNFVFWISGIAILCIGIWMKVKLYKYMELSTEFSDAAPYVLIGIGTFIIIIGTLACCCTVKGQPVLLYVYGAFLALIFVLEFGAGVSIFAYRTKLMAGFDKGLNESMLEYRAGDSEKINDFDTIQTTLHCCGNHDYSDWLNINPSMNVPSSCCIQKGCDVADVEQIYTEGCFEKVKGFLDANIGIVAGAAVGIAFFPIIGVILSCCLARFVNKAKYEQMA